VRQVTDARGASVGLPDRVERVVSHDDARFGELCLLDLPDYDSVEPRHRATVDQLLPKVDAVCWVLDPEKYGDRVLHEDYLRPLAHHADRAVFVVNRRDVIGGPEQVAALTADLRRRLEGEGLVLAAGNWKLLSEEAPYAYKDATAVVETCAAVGLSRVVARLRPAGVLKG
jgi:hypothetical protein